jgi:thiamine-phosphate pyrophosphorylase
MHKKLHGLYAITDANQTDQTQLIADVTQVLLGGARIIQYRDKTEHHDLRLNTAKQLRELTQQHNALFIINDDVQLTEDSHADGVHLGADDLSIAAAREQLGPTAIIGVSCYNDFKLAKQAASHGADYIAFGRFFSSRTKPNATQADMKILQTAKRELNIPVVAIGGITADNGDKLIDAGADMLAIVDDIFGQTDIKSAAQRYQQLFTTL